MIENNREKAPYLVVELLESFSTKELKGLQKIVSCTYFNTDRYVIKLLEVLIKKVLHQTLIDKLVQLRLYNQVFSDLQAAENELSKKQKAILRSKISSLTRLSERFLTIEALKESDINDYDLKLNALLDKKQYRLFNKHLKKATAICGTDLERMKDFGFKFSIEKNRLKYLHQTGKWLKEDNLNELQKIIDLQYLIEKIDCTLNAMAFQTRKPKILYDLSAVSLTDSKIFAKYLNGDFPLLTLQLASIKLSSQKTSETYEHFINLLEQNEVLISNEELKGYYTMALNFCVLMANKKGKKEYIIHYTKLQKLLDEKELILTSNSITLQKLKNIVTNGCKAKEYKWVSKMIKKYTPFISEKYRTDVEKFNLGYLDFQQCKYDEAIDHLLEVNNFQKSYDRDKRMLILKAYYEIEKHYTEPTAQLFRSFEMYVLEHKQYTEVDKISYKNTIRIFYNLYRYKHNVGKMTLDTLQEKIEQAEYITSKAWLLEKIEELRG